MKYNLFEFVDMNCMTAILQKSKSLSWLFFKYVLSYCEHGVGIKCLTIEIFAGKRNFYGFNKQKIGNQEEIYIVD
jgi:hypothetical protein